MYSKQQGTTESGSGGSALRRLSDKPFAERPPLGRPPLGRPSPFGGQFSDGQPADGRPSDGQPSYRQPPRPRLQVPPNYSGHAIVDGEERSLGRAGAGGAGDGEESLAERSVPPRAPTEKETPTPRFDDLPRVGRSGEPTHALRALPLSATEAQPASAPVPAPSAEGEEPSTPALARGAPPPPRPLFGLHTFPFGHGLGTEELLLLGLILLLWREGEGEERGDLYETLLLLGLLLLLG